MNLSEVHQGVQKRKKRKRVGRGVGSGHGKTAGRGHKGQFATSGSQLPSTVFEGGQMALFRRMPKRGFSNATFARNYAEINLRSLEKKCNAGDQVDVAKLRELGLVKGPCDGIRILGSGELTKKLTVKANHVTKSAKEKIEARGGTIELVAPPKKPKRNKMKPRRSKEIKQ